MQLKARRFGTGVAATVAIAAVTVAQASPALAAGSRDFDAARQHAHAWGSVQWGTGNQTVGYTYADVVAAKLKDSGPSSSKSYASVRYHVGNHRNGRTTWDPDWHYFENKATANSGQTKNWSWSWTYNDNPNYRIKDVAVQVCNAYNGWVCSAWK